MRLDAREFPRLDYERHPAFRAHVHEAKNEPDLGRVIAEIDEALDETVHTSDSEALRRRFVSEIEPRLRELRTLAHARSHVATPATDASDHALQACRTRLLSEMEFVAEKRNFAGTHYHRAANVSSDLDEDGFAARPLDDRSYGRVQSAVDPYLHKLYAQRQAKPTSRCVISIPMLGEARVAVQSALDEMGFLHAASEYRRHHMVVAACALQLSHADETWWRDCYIDVGIPSAKTSYFHNDEDDATLKVMLYLSVATARNGAFSVIPGSHRWRRSRCATRIHKCLDKALRRQLLASDPSATEYVKVFRYTPFREEFMSLPYTFRATSHFGDDIVDGSLLSEELIGSERTLTSDEARGVLFDGSALIHRGGCVQEGTRVALQVSLQARESIWNRARDAPRAATSYLAHRFVGQANINMLRRGFRRS